MADDIEKEAPSKLIKWREDVKLGKNTHYKGTTDMVTDAEYDHYVLKMGWAEDAETGEAGERATGPVTVQIDNVKTSLK